MGKSAGPTPDYAGAAQQQQQSSAQNINAQTMANRPNISTPFATQGWTQGPDGSWNMSSGFQGGLGDAASSLTSQAGQSLSQSVNPMLFGPVANGDAARDQAITGAYNQATSRLNPQWEQSGQMLQSQLANQGLDPNSQASRNASRDFGQQRNDAYMGAMNSAIGQGTQAGSAVFDQNMQSHQQALADALRQRDQPLSELGQLQGFSATPQFNQAGAADPLQALNATAATGNYQLQDAQQRNQILGDAMGALGGIFGGGASIFKGLK